MSVGAWIHFKGDAREAAAGVKVDLLNSACCGRIDPRTNSSHTCRQSRKPRPRFTHWHSGCCLCLRNDRVLRHTFPIVSQICLYFLLLSFPDASRRLRAVFFLKQCEKSHIKKVTVVTAMSAACRGFRSFYFYF